MFFGIIFCEYAENETIKAAMKQKKVLTSIFSFQDKFLFEIGFGEIPIHKLV